MLIDELIERAFSDGYEYALEEQREFAFKRDIRAARGVIKNPNSSKIEKFGNVMNLIDKSNKQVQRISGNTPFYKMSPDRRRYVEGAIKGRAERIGKLYKNATGTYDSVSHTINDLIRRN